MQFDKDMSGNLSEIFIKARDIVLDFEGMSELKNAKQTSYRYHCGVIVMMRGKDDMFVLSFGHGAKLQDEFAHLSGDGKIVRHWNLYSPKDLDEKILKKMINESIILNIEKTELQKLRKNR